MTMNDRLYKRMMYRIPALLGHIENAKTKKQPARVHNFQNEYDRRYKEMVAAGNKTVIDKAIKAKKAELATASEKAASLH